ncbi:hypothetical protein [Sphingomonas lacusdianchii]|uniref:hypothetical protein n=1 Tax=Sphingomonas lacusdianchii TaxID=2917992 RepID=UPI001F55DBE1|nr:hypothetical protein [Sphingomonas sp. JXJ CY 53]
MEDSAVQPIERDTRPQSFEDVERSMRRITDRYTWKRVFLFAALFIWLFNAYAALPYVDGRSYIAVWVVACIGCWTASGWLLDLPRLMFPEVEAFRHLRRPAPRQ